VNWVSAYQDVGDLEAWDVESRYVIDYEITICVAATYQIRCNIIRV
jgi:hypothetical protein